VGAGAVAGARAHPGAVADVGTQAAMVRDGGLGHVRAQVQQEAVTVLQGGAKWVPFQA
jgi:hypothetical protein